MDFKQHLYQFIAPKTADDLLQSLEKEPVFGLRVNPLKISTEQMKQHFPFLNDHPFVLEGLIASQARLSGKHPLHLAGAFYIQEPSAMVVASLLTYHPDDKVIDVCAAPGGKATQAGLKLGENGLLIANDSNFMRAKILSENIERIGLRNAFVTSNSIDELLTSFQGFFDKVILDAPCSGSGMFRKNQEVKKDWSYEKVLRLQTLQKELIVKSYRLLKNKGYLLYSTCSFSKEENEDVIQHLLQHTKAILCPLPNLLKVERGINMPEAIRIYPHLFPGEGHFIALIQAKDETPPLLASYRPKPMDNAFKSVYTFYHSFMTITLDPKRLIFNQNHVHYLPVAFSSLPALKLLRSGLHLGEIKKDRFEPSHALAMASQISDWKHNLSFALGSSQLKAFLAGESFKIATPIQGYVLVCCENVPLGLAKIVDGVLKNHYPKGLRVK